MGSTRVDDGPQRTDEQQKGRRSIDISYSQTTVLDEPLTGTTAGRATQAVILAAGRGQRLAARVEEFPKCLLQVGGRALLNHQLAMLGAAGIRDICVVAGYHHSAVARVCRGRAHVINNRKWATTNSLYSLWLTRHWVTKDMVVMNCDVLADQRILSRLLEQDLSSFAFDSGSGEDEEHMKVQLTGDTLRSMSKTLDGSLVHGENVGMLKFSAFDARDLFAVAGTILEGGGENMWMASAVEELASDHSLRGVDVRGLSWIEIDYQEDLDDARCRVWPSIEPVHRPGQVLSESRRNLI